MVTLRQLDALVMQMHVSAVPGQPSYTTFDELKQFFVEENVFWSRLDCPNASAVQRYIQNAANGLHNVRNSLEQLDSNSARRMITEALQEWQSNRGGILSKSPEGQFLVSLDQPLRDGAYAYLVGPIEQSRLSARPYWNGFLNAFLLKNPDAIDRVLRAHTAAFAQLSTDITAYRDQQKSDYDTLRRSFEAWRSETEQRAGELLSTTGQEFQVAHALAAQRIDTLCGSWESQFKNTHSAYDAQLKLKAPAEYWKSLMDEYKGRGRMWAVISLSLTAVLIGGVVCILYWPPQLLVDGKQAQQTQLTLASIRATLLMTVIISALVYLIHLSIKLATSAYHLSRDARERWNLTLVFLALVKDGALKREELTVVLQSLFSRADTGLLKNDGVPAMPGPLGTIIETVGRNR